MEYPVCKACIIIWKGGPGRFHLPYIPCSLRELPSSSVQVKFKKNLLGTLNILTYIKGVTAVSGHVTLK